MGESTDDSNYGYVGITTDNSKLCFLVEFSNSGITGKGTTTGVQVSSDCADISVAADSDVTSTLYPIVAAMFSSTSVLTDVFLSMLYRR